MLETGPDSATACAGIILAGGLSRRMGANSQAVDKGLMHFRGRPMVAHVIERLAPQVTEVLVSANRNIAQYATLGPAVVCDEIPGFSGPLAGIHAALAQTKLAWLVSAPCDSPFLPLDLVTRLQAAALATGAPLAVAHVDARDQPVFLLVHRSLRDGIDTYLKSGQAKVDRWYAPIKRATVQFDDASAFRNINTLEELTRFEHE